LAEPKPMMLNGQNKVSELANRATAAAAKIDALYAQRRALALDAADGNKSAAKQIESIDAETNRLLSTQATLLAAVEAAQERDRETIAAREAADRQKHLAEATRVATAAMKVSEEIDAALAALTRLFERRKKLIGELARTGVFPPHLAMRLLGRTAGTAAARSAGLAAYLDIAHIAPSHARPLAETSSVLGNELSWPEQTTASATPPPTTSSLRRFRLFGG
jgi:hypothetical protein